MEKQGTPNLPFLFKRVAVFLATVKVSAVQQKDLDLARNAMDEILDIVYGPAESRACTGVRPVYPQIG